jgi:hypothetical protein
MTYGRWTVWFAFFLAAGIADKTLRGQVALDSAALANAEAIKASDAVRNLYAACNEGRHGDASVMFRPQLRTMRAVERLCEANTRKRSLTDIQITARSASGWRAVVIARLSFKDGSTLYPDTTWLLQESGAWLIALGAPSGEQSRSNAQVIQPNQRSTGSASVGKFATFLDRETGSTITFAQACPGALDAFAYASQEIPFKVRVDAPTIDSFKAMDSFRGLAQRAVDLAKTVCGQGVVVTRADLTFLAPGFADTLAPAAMVRYRGGILNQMSTGAAESSELHNYVAVKINWTKFVADYRVVATPTFAELTGNPFAYTDQVVAIGVAFQTMESPIMGLFGGGDATETVAITDLPPRLYKLRGQRTVVAARVRGKTDREIGGVRVPLLSFVGAYLCSDSKCSDILP